MSPCTHETHSSKQTSNRNTKQRWSQTNLADPCAVDENLFSLPAPHGETCVDHLATPAKCVVGTATPQFVEEPDDAPKKHWITPASWQNIQQVHAAKRDLRFGKDNVSATRQGLAFHGWKNFDKPFHPDKRVMFEARSTADRSACDGVISKVYMVAKQLGAYALMALPECAARVETSFLTNKVQTRAFLRLRGPGVLLHAHCPQPAVAVFWRALESLPSAGPIDRACREAPELDETTQGLVASRQNWKQLLLRLQAGCTSSFPASFSRAVIYLQGDRFLRPAHQ